jgi:NADH dehydrogenase (ubiquinone) Fe-S protein 4
MKKSLQNGEKYAHQWQLTWKNGERWTNPLMGWTSSADPMSQVKVKLTT